MMRARRIEAKEAAFILFVAFFGVYAGLMILKTSFILHGDRCFTLFDDAMISMRYARNFAHGYGLCYNPGGPKVEGFSNPLWVLVMAVVHFLPLAERVRAVSIQILGAISLATNLWLVRALVRRLAPRSELAAWLALLPVAFYLPLNNWSVQGMETGPLAALATATVLATLRAVDGSGRPRIPFLLAGIAMLLRPDMVILLIAVSGYLWIVDPANRRRHAILAGGSLLVFAGAPLIFRLAYFGDLVPNTYRLKLEGYPTGDRIARGAVVFGSFVWQFGLLLFAIPIVRALVRPRRERLLPLAVFGLLGIYSVYVGGDAWEGWGGANRFLCVGIPLFLVLFGIGVAEGATWIGEAIGSRRPASRVRWRMRWRAALAAGAIIFTIASTLQMNRIPGSPDLRAFFLAEKPLEGWGNAWATEIGRICESITTEKASMAVVWAGNIPYYAHRDAIDLLGRCDAKIAREAAHPRPDVRRQEAFYPGHMKWDYAYSIGELAPDLIVQLWGLDRPPAYTMLGEIPEDARPYIRDRYVLLDIRGYRILARRDSRNVRWEYAEPYIRSYQP
jgi:arabinofuranosyltransferase